MFLSTIGKDRFILRKYATLIDKAASASIDRNL